MTERMTEMFGSMVFDDKVMKERLPQRVYEALHHTIASGTELDPTVADAVAIAMRDWAVEKGATHYTHWFQPMNGITAEKHDSFLSPGTDGRGILEFSASALTKGEPDASSFPSGGLRATFEARGYTAWDPTSYAFIKGNSLCIPTIFCSYNGATLDKKTPLLRSVQILDHHMMRILKVLGRDDVQRVIPCIGPEQEYFLVDNALAQQRRDLILTGRTLFGARPAKSQEMEDHYFGAIRPRVANFMAELNEELWKLGICAKTEHNENAPGQHELAPLYEDCNSATDHNQLVMEMMRRVAEKQGLCCLLHEKPYTGVNGSGKHNNWSLNTDRGENLLKPGRHPEQNKIFLLLMVAVIRAVDEYQDLLRVSSASAGNDLRLGAAEAPPAIISIFLGSHLSALFDALEQGQDFDPAKRGHMQLGVAVVPEFKKDTEDRNRTSPMAFTGNKFEFRMLGSSFSIADTNIILNTIVTDVLADFADRLEAADDVDAALEDLLRTTYRDHKRIVFNGNNYAQEWVEEAERRGLQNLRTTPDALARFIDEKNVDLFVRHGVLSREEMYARYEIQLENYRKVRMIEARTMVEMAQKQILPAAFGYCGELAQGLRAKKEIGLFNESDADCLLLERVQEAANCTAEALAALEAKLRELTGCTDNGNCARRCCEELFPLMQELRKHADLLETLVAADRWPYPIYEELMYSV